MSDPRAPIGSVQCPDVDIEVRDLRLVMAVAEMGSLAKASEKLHVTPSALSHQLRRLEGALGARLFSRNDRGMRLTAAGQRLFSSAGAVLTEISAAEHAVRAGERCAGRQLRLGIECHTCYDLLPAVVHAFRKRYPAVEIEIEPGAAEHPLQRITAGELDVAVMISATPPRSTAMSYPLLVDELVGVIPPDHRLAGRKFMGRGDLAQETVLVWISPERSAPLAQFLKQDGIGPRAVKVVPLAGAAVSLVTAGAGVAVLPQRVARAHVNDGSLQLLSLQAGGLRQQWSVVTPSRTAPSAHVQEFVRLLVEHARQREASPVVKLRALRTERRAASGGDG